MNLGRYLPYAASLVVSSALAATGVYQFSYDATTHVFFASHYAGSWFSLWDVRWYGGMSVAGYPPLVHQLMALASYASGLVPSFAVVAVAAALFLTWSAKKFAGSLEMDSSAVAWLVALSPGVFLFLYGFGQLPQVVSTAFVLAGGAHLNSFVTSGRRRDLLFGGLFAALALFCNLEAPLIGLPAVAVVALARAKRPIDALRVGYWVGLTALVAAPILYQVLLFIQGTPAQAPIPQETRFNIFATGNTVMLFLGIYGPLIFLLPLGAYAALKRKKRVFLILTLLLVVMGLGGTTPLPELLLGQSLYSLLTYEKFSFLAMLFLAVPVGVYLEGFWKRKGLLVRASKYALVVVLLLSTAGALVNTYQVALPTASPDLGGVAAYLNSQPGSGYWVTLGVGPIGRELSLNTTHPTLDGGFNTARRLPVLYQSGVDSIDNAKYFPGGPALINNVLGGNYGVRWAIVGDGFYVPFLRFQGYRPVENISGPLKVGIWEKSDYQAGFNATYSVKEQTSYSWGAYPLAILLATAALGWYVGGQDRRRPETLATSPRPGRGHPTRTRDPRHHLGLYLDASDAAGIAAARLSPSSPGTGARPR